MSKIKSTPPIAPIIETSYSIHNQTISDDYAWLRDKDWPNVQSKPILEYIEQENLYYEEAAASFKYQKQELYEELLSREIIEDESVPIKDGEYYYYRRLKKDLNHPIYCRKHLSLDSLEEVIFNPNDLSQQYPNLKLGSVRISPDHNKLLYALDIDGSERFKIFVLDLASKKSPIDSIDDTIGNIVWDKESKGFFYLKLNEYWRTDKVYYHAICTSQSNDALIYKEDDALFTLSIKRSASKKYLIVTPHSFISTEAWTLDIENPSNKLKLIIPRQDNKLYNLDHINHDFYVLTNDKTTNFRLIRFNENETYNESINSLTNYKDNVYLNDLWLFNSFFVVEYKVKGLANIDIFSHDLTYKQSIPFQDPVYDINIYVTPAESEGVIYEYSSLNTPKTVYEYNFNTRKITTLKKDIVPGYNTDLYKSERIYAKAHDGVEVPISLVYRKDLFKSDGSNPLLLYGYGSYAHAISGHFRSSIITLLDKGFVYAIAHIRGGDDLGYQWYEDGKLLKKKNTFFDFISCAEYLIENQYTSKGNISIEGGSAGGMLIGFCINERPELFKGAIAKVPFVDVLNTMLDENLPLTPGEYVEWGNPKEEGYFEYIKSYSPYDNIKRQSYPALLMTAGLNDPRVGYWEAAKFTAKLRSYKTDTNPLFLHTLMETGHFGNSGRFKSLMDIAQVYSFILHIHDV